ncbi:MAG: hypothetical protein ACI9C1_000746 [Candidatus Aldehydirespiratoraceae bacterium]
MEQHRKQGFKMTVTGTTELAIVDLPLERLESEITELSGHLAAATARLLDDLPQLTSVFAAGELSFTKVRALTRVATAGDELEWIELARSSSGAQLERVVTQSQAAVERNENADARRAFERRSATRSSRSDGLDQLKLVGPSDAIDVIWAALDVIASRLIDDAVDGEQTRRETMAERGGRAMFEPR